MAYLEVSSNDTLSHKSLPGSPETLCGKAITDEKQPRDHSVDQQAKPNTGVMVQSLICDICETLSGGLLKETVSSIVEAGRICPYCEEGKNGSLDCPSCRGTGWLDEGDVDDSLLNDLSYAEGSEPYLRGTRVAMDLYEGLAPTDYLPDIVAKDPNSNKVGPWTNGGNESGEWTNDDEVDEAGMASAFPQSLTADANPATSPNQNGHYGPAKPKTSRFDDFTAGFNEKPCDNCGEPTGGVTKTVGNEDWCTQCSTSPVSTNSLAPTKTLATNWTRDGEPIIEGTNVIISAEEASRTPFLDLSKVTISEKKTCPDCETQTWLQSLASCDSCGHVKCKTCMEVVGLDSFFGMCKKCASANSDLSYEVEYEDTLPDQDRYLSYLMQEEDDGNYDSLFLPHGEL